MEINTLQTGSLVSLLALATVIFALSSPFDYAIWAMERPDVNFWITLFPNSTSFYSWILARKILRGYRCRFRITNFQHYVVIYSLFRFYEDDPRCPIIPPSIKKSLMDIHTS